MAMVDADVLVNDQSVGIFWLENLGHGEFADEQLIFSSDDVWILSLSASDLDSDGDNDLVFTYQEDIYWIETTNGQAGFGERQLLHAFEKQSDQQVDVLAASGVDVDLDGDRDVVSVVSIWDDGSTVYRVSWFKNSEGEFGEELLSHEISDIELAFGLPWSHLVTAVDVDLDSDLDLISLFSQTTSWKGAWYENRLAGDANDDGNVEFADFLTLSGNFGERTPEWEEGDFDGNGTVDFADFLILSFNFGAKRPVLP